ncbi:MULTISPECIES: class I adenylate-forming enzyme family protein [unclassified Streptomyces]|uniref:class I adenylate-forming enzyme family protein n=1 Tax=unclassified Streptomyces TaxID=2593676 RepID=UPI001907B552|nr:AMP-binding protein [Streptomyces sp. HSG2]
MPVCDLFARARIDRADHPAVVDPDGGVVTYRDLGERVDRAVGWLRAQGVSGGARVVYAGGNDATFLSVFHAALRLGAVFVPVHPELTDDQVAHVVRDCSAGLAICGSAAGSRATRTVEVDRARREIGGFPADDHVGSVTDDDIAVLIYTSGTTGRPKGVVCPHRQMLAATRAVDARLGYRADDVVLCRLPLSFDYGLYQALLCALNGATLVLADREGDRGLLSTIERHGVTVVPLVPSLAQMLTLLRRRSRRPTAVRLFTNTGARPGQAVVAELLELFPGSVFASMYGMTECQRISILDPAEYATHPGSVGRAIPGDHVRVVAADGSALGPGEVGEIVVWGSTVMDGYWGLPLERQNRYARRDDGSLELRTGDRGYLDEEGLLYFVGRDDDMIKRRGVRIGLTEIEDAAERISGVTAAVALRPEDEDAPLRLAVLTALRPEEVRERLARFLDRARMPDRIVLIEDVPLTANGKPDREAVRRLCAATAGEHDIAPSAQTGTSHEPVTV